MITLYDLVFSEDRRPSPYCWRAKLAMKHKGLAWRDEIEATPDAFRDGHGKTEQHRLVHDQAPGFETRRQDKDVAGGVVRCKVGLVARRQEKLQALAQEIAQAGGSAAIAAADVGNRVQLSAAIRGLLDATQGREPRTSPFASVLSEATPKPDEPA